MMKTTHNTTATSKLYLVAFLAGLPILMWARLGYGAPVESVDAGAEIVFGSDDRTTYSWSTAVSGPLAAVGTLSRPGASWNYCTGTLFAADKVISAQHCGIALNDEFRPHGSAVAARVTRIVLGRDSTLVHGDWAFLDLDRSFTDRPTMSFAIPDQFPMTVNDAGYSGDLPASTLGVHFNCQLRKDIGDAILSDCDTQGGASGGPLYRVDASGRGAVYAVNSGHHNHLPNGTPYSDDVANTVTGAKYFAFAPDNPFGLSTALTADGRLQVYSTDRDWSLIATRWKLSTDSSSNWTEWRSHDSRFSGGRKIATANLADKRQQFFVVTDQGQLKTRWETALGVSFSDWFDVAAPTTLKDVAATGGEGQVTQLYVLGTNGTTYTIYKLGDSSSNWSEWCSLGTVQGAKSVSISRFGGVQQLFVAAPSGAYTAWTDGNACSHWVPIRLFQSGSYRTTAAGVLQDGRTHAFFISTAGALKHGIRRLDGSAWSWETFPQANPPGSNGFIAMTTGRITDGREQLFAIATNGEVFSTWEISGSFVPWSRFYE